CHPERSEGPLHLLAAPEIRARQKTPRKFCLATRSFTEERFEPRRAGGRRYDSGHALSGAGEAGRSAKITLSRRSSMLTGRKLALTLAFTVLVVVAFGVSCRGFFQPNSLETIAIQPPSLDLAVDATQQFSAWGTYQDGSRKQLTSGLVWTSTDTVDAPITAAGLVTGVSVTPASVTITGAAQGLSGTATLNVIGDVNTMTVSPGSQSMSEGTAYPFTFTGSPGPPTYITTSNGGTLTITFTGTTASASDLTCTVGTDTSGNPAESCTAQSGAVAG